jgi:hypothetical protein
MERLSTSDKEQAAFRSIVDAWVYALEEDLLAAGDVSGQDASVLVARTNELIEKRLAAITELAPAFSAALRGYRAAVAAGENATAEALLAWVSGQPNVAAPAKRTAGIKGEIDHFSALCFLQGLLIMLRDAGFAGLVLVLDEVETLQRVDVHPDFDPRRDYALTVADAELSDQERAVATVDDIELRL